MIWGSFCTHGRLCQATFLQAAGGVSSFFLAAVCRPSQLLFFFFLQPFKRHSSCIRPLLPHQPTSNVLVNGSCHFKGQPTLPLGHHATVSLESFKFLWLNLKKKVAGECTKNSFISVDPGCKTYGHRALSAKLLDRQTFFFSILVSVLFSSRALQKHFKDFTTCLPLACSDT